MVPNDIKTKTKTKTKTYDITIDRGGSEPMTFTLELAPELTVLDALEEIRYSLDDTLLYRHSCHHGSCGTCACIINGTEALACMSVLSSLPGQEITIRPLEGFPVIGDLLVDLSEMVRLMPEGPCLRDSTLKKESLPPEGVDRWVRFENCIECGSCMSACPVTGPFIGPAPLAALHRAIEQTEDPQELERLRSRAYAPDGVDGCDAQFACSRVCPVKVAPGRHITQLKRERTS
ncbi:MAG: 4Fe-4S dicluster domain-containing protein [Spirochaetia bacterium]|nr:4Fe-4S dicluster domain-containing protein [Spirochaetia bacterium]